MHLLFITTHNLGTNPRIVKEVQLAVNEGYEVTLICFTFNNWSRMNHEEIKKTLKNKITLIEIPGNRKPFLPWLMSTVVFEGARLLLNILPDNSALLSWACNKRSWLLNEHLKRLNKKYDWVIAHNIGAFYPALNLAQKNGTRLGIDLEDYHPGETTIPKEIRRSEKLIKHILPNADYVTAASPLILEEYKKLVSFDSATEVVMNYFHKDEFVPPSMAESDSFQLVWFSQNISFRRGLEQIIPLVDGRKNVELHLYGNCKEEFYNQWIAGRDNIFVHNALSQLDLHKELSLYDAGLAIEPGRDRNNELAVSNKMLAYYQAGLYIIASDTPAQRDFLKTNQHSGIVLSLYDSGLESRFEKILESLHSIRSTKQARYYYAWSMNWESESEKLLKLWEGLGATR
ncbi:MAG: hypothetical protein J5I50_13885 [Chitinophagaceae bacterium]|nr:hypothetical protein [Chitinophagaceae bacterium]